MASSSSKSARSRLETVLSHIKCAGEYDKLMGYAEDNKLKASELFDTVSGKNVLITGGSIGIGRMIAEGFVRNGCNVYICSRKKEACDQTALELTHLGPGKAFSLPGDLSTEAGINSVAQDIKKHVSKLHILVNNAGATWGGTFDEFSFAGWQRTFDLNVRAVFALTQQLSHLLEAAATPDDMARVINISSVVGTSTGQWEDNAAWSYAPSKAALENLTRGLVKVLGQRSITVNAIAPGMFATKMNAHLIKQEGAMEYVANSTALGRIGQPSDMAGTALFLASRAGAYITGAVIPVAGGIYKG